MELRGSVKYLTTNNSTMFSIPQWVDLQNKFIHSFCPYWTKINLISDDLFRFLIELEGFPLACVEGSFQISNDYCWWFL